MNKGSWAFLIGLVIAIVLAFFAESTRFLPVNLVAIILIVIGLIVGFLNLSSGAEVLLAYVALMVIAFLVSSNVALSDFSFELSNIILYIAAVAIVIAIKMILFESVEEAVSTTPVTKPARTGKRVA